MKISAEKLLEILDGHKKWLAGEADGQLADLSGADLCGADLSGADLSGADLWDADLSAAKLSAAKLSAANLHGANLSGADLSAADLHGAKLHGVDLRGADLRGANLSGADLSAADLHGAKLHGVDLEAAPVVPALKAAIVEAIGPKAEHLDMETWGGENACGTTHCLAGWAVALGGETAQDLERRLGTNAAAALIFHASLGVVPDFFASDAAAIAWLRD